MRKSLVVFFFLVTTSTCLADELLGPGDYLKILADSKLHYRFLSEPSKTPMKQATCGRRTYSLRLVAKDKEKSLVPWTVKPEAKKLLDEAEELYDAKKIEEASLKYKAAINIDPEAVSGYLFYGDTLLFGSGRDAEAALEQYRKAIALDPTLPVGHFFSATALNMLGRPDEAREEIIKALTYDPAYEAIWKIAAGVPGEWNTKPIARHKFEPPVGFLGTTEKKEIDIYSGPKFEFLGYATCKAVWANEARFSKQHGGPDDWSLEEERACLANQLYGGHNAAEAHVTEAQKKNGVAKPVITEADTIAAMTPLDRHLFDVAKAGMLDGYILFEIIGQHCPAGMSMVSDEALKQVDAYIRKFVIVAKE